MSIVDRLKASYARLEAGHVYVRPGKPRVPKKCQQCDEPAWSEGLCMAHIQERAREITNARKYARKEARRKEFFLAKRAARYAGDLELWSEIGWRQRKGDEIPKNTAPDAPWRSKWRRTLTFPLPATTSMDGPTHPQQGTRTSNDSSG